MHPRNHNLIFAVQMMCRPVGERPKRKLYGWLRRRFSDRMTEIQSGSTNSQFGSFWITDGLTSRKIPSNGSIPVGWSKGRVIKSDEEKKISLCVDCGEPTGSRRRKRCNSHHHENLSKLASVGSNFRGAYEGKVFITDGNKDKLHQFDEIIPEGWRRGRSTNASSLKKRGML